MHGTDPNYREPSPAALLLPKQCSQQTGLSERTLANWRSMGKGPAFLRVGRKVMYDPRDLEAWLSARRFRSTSEADALAAA